MATLLPHVDAGDVARDLVTEALWDCEPEARTLACGVISTATFADARRLSELADDEFEEAAVRTAARLSPGR